MLDLAYLRKNLQYVQSRLVERGDSNCLDDFKKLDEERRTVLAKIEGLKAKRNLLSAEVAKAKQDGENVDQKIIESREIGVKIKELSGSIEKLEESLQNVLRSVPNIPHESVPQGDNEAENVEIRCWGQNPSFNFEPKAHWDLGPNAGILDFERAAKVAGARFAVYWNAGAKLERALLNFMLDVHTEEHGYTEVLPPFIVNSKSLFGTGQLPKFSADLFKLENSDYWLTPTAEVPITNLFSKETLPAAELPIKLVAYTPCFRSEAGSYGRDVRGIIRQHQFQKIEMVKFTSPDQSYNELELLTSDAENILQKLGLPYRTVVLCSGDMGFASAKTYDIEVWLPGQKEFKEISSCSNFEDFQARRSGIRFRNSEGTKGKTHLVHTLNGSGLAIGRTWVAIIENYQRKDGGITIPKVLRRYLNSEGISPTGELE